MNGAETANLVLAQMQPGPLGGLLPMILVLVVFYFLLIRPQQKKAKDHQTMIDALKKNDQVVTTGGLYGRVTEIKDSVVSLEIARGVTVRYEKSSIGSVRDGKKEG